MTDEPSTERSSRRSRPDHLIMMAAALAYGGIAVMSIALFLTVPRIIPTIGTGMVLVAAVPYALGVRGRIRETASIQAETLETLRESHEAFLAAQDTQLEQLKEITAQIQATTRVFRLERIEEKVYAEILGVDPDDVLVMEWPKDGLRDSVIVYFTEGPAVTYPLTIDQMNQAAETINQRMDQHDQGESQP